MHKQIKNSVKTVRPVTQSLQLLLLFIVVVGIVYCCCCYCLLFLLLFIVVVGGFWGGEVRVGISVINLLCKQRVRVLTPSQDRRKDLFHSFQSVPCYDLLVPVLPLFPRVMHKNQLRTLRIPCPTFSRHQWYEKNTNST